MSSNPQEILDTILSRLRSLVSTDTVVGQPVTVGDLTLLPVIKLSVGFAAGGGEGGDEKSLAKGIGSGGGGGANVTPVGFIAYDGKEVKFISINKGKIDTLLESVPELLKKFGIPKAEKGKPEAEDKPS
jgi:uncharacterized spore protein YtfJ